MAEKIQRPGKQINAVIDEKKEGLWREIDEKDDRIIRMGNYKHNEKNGIWKTYFKQKLRRESEYKNDEENKSEEFETQTVKLVRKKYNN